LKARISCLALTILTMLGQSVYCATTFKLTVQFRAYTKADNVFVISYSNHYGIPVLIPICQDKIQSANLLDTLKASPAQTVELTMRSKNGYAKIDSITENGNLCVEDVQIILSSLD
jgi:hypothetical protein